MDMVVVEPTNDDENGVGGGAGVMEGLVNLFGADNLFAVQESQPKGETYSMLSVCQTDALRF
jgi:hypothetical protein